MAVCAVTVLLLLTGLSGLCAVRPGFQARITQHGLDYANQKAIDALEDEVMRVQIPDQSGSEGSLSYTLSQIHVTGFTKPASSIKLKPKVGLTWSAAKAGVSLKSNWRARFRKGWFKVSVSGSLDASVHDVNFQVTMAFGTDAEGRPSIKSGGCACQVGSVDIDFHGDVHWFLNLFKGQVEKKVKDLLPGKLCGAVNGLINNNAENALKKLKVKTELVNSLFTLDYRLVEPPSFLPAYMETYHKGEITWTKDPQPPPFSPLPLPPSPSTSRMMYLWVGEYVPRSLLYTAHKHGFLRYNLTKKDLPAAEKDFLNTTCIGVCPKCTFSTCIGLLFPQVAKKYPGRSVALRMNSTMIPEVSMTPDLLTSRLAGDIALYIDTDARPPPYLLTVGVSAVFNLTATVSNQLIKGAITGFSFKVQVLDSAVGPIKSNVVNTLVGLAMKLFIIPTINKQGAKGFPLPVEDNVKFTNTHLQIQQDAMLVDTDLEYNFSFH